MTTTDPTRPVRILHIAQATEGGLGVYVSDLAAYQRTQGIDARIACPPTGYLPELASRDDVPLIAWPATRHPGPSLPGECRRLAAIIDEFDPDIVHLSSSKAGLAGRLVLRGRRPTVFSPQAWSFLLPGWTSAPSRAWERFAVRWTDQILVACDEEAEVGRAAGIAGAYEVAENGVDPERYAYADDDDKAAARVELGLGVGDRPVVVCVGRLCHQKGQEMLLDAWRLVRRDVPDGTLLLVGDGDPGHEASLRAIAPDGVEFVGAQSNIPRWLAAADVVVQPSRYEGMSFSVIEALSVGRPVVAFDVIGMHASISDDAGAVVPPGDVPALAAGLVERLLDPDRCRREGDIGRARVVGRLTVDNMRSTATRCTLQLGPAHAATTTS